MEVDLPQMNTMTYIISTGSIQAHQSHVVGDSSSPQKIHLTPWDLVSITVEMNKKGLLFNNPINIKHQIHNLKQSLSSTLSFFPPLAGRLVILQHEEDNTVSSHIICNNAGALFVHAALSDNTCVSDILHSNYVPPVVNSFFPLNGVKNYQGTSHPLLAVQITELVDGIFIGISMNHLVADGKAFWHFINSWAEISRACDVISKLPTLERWFLDRNRCPIRFPFNKEDQMKHSEDCTNNNQRIFHFTKEKIARIKSKANAEASTDKISSLQALLTHLWRTVIRNEQQLDPEKEINYGLVIDVRGRIVPPLPDSYFGNALSIGVVTMKAGELVLEGGLGKGALEMHKMIASHSDEKLKSRYESWVRPPSMFQSGGLSNMLGTSSSPRFNVYGNDFGWGKPVAVRSGNSMKGITTVFAGAEEGGIDLIVCLPYEVLEAIGNDPHFMDAFSI